MTPALLLFLFLRCLPAMWTQYFYADSVSGKYIFVVFDLLLDIVPG